MSARTLFTTAGCVVAGLTMPTLAAAQEPSRTGRQVYETICITCHGPEGRGGVNL